MKRTIGLALILLVTIPVALFMFSQAAIWGALTTLGLAVAVVGVALLFTSGIALVTSDDERAGLMGRVYAAIVYRRRDLEIRRRAARERER